MKIKCNECKSTFYEKELAYTLEDKEDCCPICGSMDIYKLQCRFCGGELDTEDNICSFCKNDLSSAVNGLIGDFADRFNVTTETITRLVLEVIYEEI